MKLRVKYKYSLQYKSKNYLER